MSVAEPIDAVPGFDRGEEIVFPFTLRSERGRIEWALEPIFETSEAGETKCVEILVSARQTKDERYAGKIFRVKCGAPRISSYHDGIDSEGRIQNFFKSVWSVEKCAEHGSVMLVAYAPDGASELVFGAGRYSSFLLQVFWR